MISLHMAMMILGFLMISMGFGISMLSNAGHGRR
jgi:hypothetical protein